MLAAPAIGESVPGLRLIIKNVGSTGVSSVSQQGNALLLNLGLPEGPMPEDLMLLKGVTPLFNRDPFQGTISIEQGQVATFEIGLRGHDPLSPLEVQDLRDKTQQLYYVGRIQYKTLWSRWALQFCLRNFPPLTNTVVTCEKWNDPEFLGFSWGSDN